MSNVSDEFNPGRGDLLYGLAAARGKYLDHIELYGTRPLDGYVTMVDDYNTQFYNSVWRKPGCPYNAHTINQHLLHFRGELMTRQPNSAPVVDDFYGKILKSRFSPVRVSSVKSVSPQKAEKEGFQDSTEPKGGGVPYSADGYTSDALNRSFLAVRRGCKFGIGFVADKVSTTRPNAVIHFALDGMRMQSILDKSTFELNLGNTAVPVTTSELRYTFRNWDRFKDRVNFYINYVKLPAPWEVDWIKDDLWGDKIRADKAGWETYRSAFTSKPQSAVKYAPGRGATV